MTASHAPAKARKVSGAAYPHVSIATSPQKTHSAHMRNRFDDEVCLQQRLAALKRDPAAARFENGKVLFEARGQRRTLYFFSADDKAVVRADMQAAAVRLAVFMGAPSFAQPAVRTPRNSVKELRLTAQPLGILAPFAAQRAAFHKNGDPHARPVVQGQLADIEYRSRHRWYSCLAITWSWYALSSSTK